ncbi:hypothetical protein RB195_000891 [Necator americanus]|uniref:EGF-like domain-containing protein n=1 Tax=Necator americanus TaxID=51031 RepID=A0ABR1DBS9_NECAM
MHTGVVVLCFVTVALAAPTERDKETDLPVSVSRPIRKDAAGESDSIEQNAIEDVKKELNRAVQGLNNTVVENNEKVSNAISDITGNLDVCTSLDCNNRGTCLGTKKNYICACLLGFSGKNCEDTVCDSARDCNGRGICLGTTTSLTCLCNLGYAGHRCEKVI